MIQDLILITGILKDGRIIRMSTLFNSKLLEQNKNIDKEFLLKMHKSSIERATPDLSKEERDKIDWRFEIIKGERNKRYKLKERSDQ